MAKRSSVDPENPEITAEQFAQAVPFDQMPAEHQARVRKLQASLRRTRGQQKAPTKALISLRLDRAIVDRYRQTGRGWQARINADLTKAAKRLPQ